MTLELLRIRFFRSLQRYAIGSKTGHATASENWGGCPCHATATIPRYDPTTGHLILNVLPRSASDTLEPDRGRMLKKLAGGGDLGPEGSHPGFGRFTKPRVKAWNRKTQTIPGKRETKARRITRLRRLWLVGAAFVACITLAAYGVVPTDHRLSPRIGHFGPNTSHNPRMARPRRPGASLPYTTSRRVCPGQIHVVISRQDHVESAVRQSLFHGDFPDVVILSEAEARSLAQLGILEPLTDDSGRGRLYLPLVEPGPWTTALVATIVGHGDDPIAQRARERFVFQLRENLHRDHQP